MIIHRRHFLMLTASAALTGCGFALRQAPHFHFERIFLATPTQDGFGRELLRQLEATGQLEVIIDPGQRIRAEVILESPGAQRERTVVSLTASGEVREYQLSERFDFRLLDAEGQERLPLTRIERKIDQSYAETEALAKEEEAEMLYRNMQSDIIQQVMRQLATIQ